MSNNRRQRPLASEREATVALNVLGTLMVAFIGTLLLTTTYFRWIRSKTTQHRFDILAPHRNVISVFDLVNQLPKDEREAFSGYMMIIVLTFALLVGRMFVPQSDSSLAEIVDAMALTFGMISVIGLPVYVYQVWKLIRTNPRFNIFIDVTEQYTTLFKDGTNSLVNPEYQYMTYTIRLARGFNWNAERNVHFMEQMLASFQPMLFRLSADHRIIEWQLVDLLGRDPESVERAIRVVYPEAQISTAKAHDINEVSENTSRKTLMYSAASPFVHPLKYAKNIKDYNPLAGVVSSMSSLQRGERITFNVFAVGVHPTAYEEGETMIRKSTIHWTDYLTLNGWRKMYYLAATGLDSVESYVPRDQRVVEDKLRELLYQVLIAIQVDSASDERTLALADTINSQMFGFAHMPYNALHVYPGVKTESEEQKPIAIRDEIVHLIASSKSLESSILARISHMAECKKCAARRMDTRLVLTAQELALLWHMPDDSFQSPRISWLSARMVPPPISVTDLDIDLRLQTHLGFGISGGKPVQVAIPLTDRESHMRVIGKTGAGKSSFLQELIRNDIGNGFGVAVVDPHGSLIESVLRYCIPHARSKDVVLIDLADQKYPPPLNPLRGGLNYVQVGQIVQSIEKMFPTTRQAPRISYYLRTALLTLNADPQATIRDVVRVLLDHEYRTSLMPLIDNLDIMIAWEQFDKMKETEKRTIIDPILTRLSPFYSNPDLASMMCHPDGLDFEKLIRERKIILISLKMNEQRVPESERNLIGALLLSRLQISGMQQVKRIPYFVYIDEVQRFVTSSLDEMFSEARKFGLSLTVAHQFLDQLPDTTQSALMSNVGASFIFASSPNDAREFAPYLQPYFSTDEVSRLDQFTAIARVQAHGVTVPPFTLLTALPLGISSEMLTTHPVFARREALVNNEATRLSKWAKKWLAVDALKHKTEMEDKYDLNASYIRIFSRELYTPKTYAEVLAWIKERYGKKFVTDTQGNFIDE